MSATTAKATRDGTRSAVEAGVERFEPAAEPASEAVGERAGAGEDRGHDGRPTVGISVELEVVDVAGHPAVGVDDLMVEEVQPARSSAVGAGSRLIGRPS